MPDPDDLDAVRRMIDYKDNAIHATDRESTMTFPLAPQGVRPLRFRVVRERSDRAGNRHPDLPRRDRTKLEPRVLCVDDRERRRQLQPEFGVHLFWGVRALIPARPEIGNVVLFVAEELLACCQSHRDASPL